MAEATSLGLKGVTTVCTDSRSLGGVSIRLMSRSPVRDMFNVLGIGVAVRVRTSIFALSCLIFSLCPTPNRCSSSTIRSPRSWKATSFERIRWVPMRMSTYPFLRSSSRAFCSFFD